MTAHCIYLRMLRDFSEQLFYRAPYFMYKLQNIMASSKTSCKMSSRSLQDFMHDAFKMSLQNFFRTSSRRLG